MKLKLDVSIRSVHTSMLTIAMAEYFLCGYHINTTPSKPYCLVYSDVKNEFSVKLLQKRKRKHCDDGRCFRHAFANADPPDPFAWIRDDVFDKHQIVSAPDIIRPIEGLSVNRKPFILTEAAIQQLFLGLPSIADATIVPTQDTASYQLTEDDVVTRFAFRKNFVSSLKDRLVAHFHFVRPSDRSFAYMVPTSPEHLLIMFEPVNVTGDGDVYPTGADDVIRRHVIIKHVIQSLICPFVHVASSEFIDLELVLSQVLPTGSAGKGGELSLPDPIDDSYYLCESSSLAYRGSDMVKIDPGDIPKGVDVVDITPEGNEGQLFEFNELTVTRGGSDSDALRDDNCVPRRRRSHPYTPLELLRYIAFNHSNAGRSGDRFFTNGSVVYTTNDRHQPFAIVDFSNYYASVVRVFQLDEYMTRIHNRLIRVRDRHPMVKSAINISIGKREKSSLRWYNLMKQLSVAVMLHTIRMNASMVCGATTDGILLDLSVLPAKVKYPDGFSMKVEFIPDPTVGMVTVSQSKYAGVDVRTGEVVHRGFIGLRTTSHPAWFRSVLDIYVLAMLRVGVGGDKNVTGIVDAMKASLSGLLSTKAKVFDLVLPETSTWDVSFTVQKHPLLVYYYNDLLQTRFQIYAVIDDKIIPPKCDNVIALPPTINVFCAKQLDVDKYADLMVSLLSKVYDSLTETDADAEAQRVFSAASEMLRTHIYAFPKEASVYPGGIGVLQCM